MVATSEKALCRYESLERIIVQLCPSGTILLLLDAALLILALAANKQHSRAQENGLSQEPPQPGRQYRTKGTKGLTCYKAFSYTPLLV